MRRPLDQICRSMLRRGWSFLTPDHPRRLFQILDRSLPDLEHLEVDYTRLRHRPQQVIEQIIAYGQLTPSRHQIQAAVDFVR